MTWARGGNIEFSYVQDPTDWTTTIGSIKMPPPLHEDNLIGMREFDGKLYVASIYGICIYWPAENAWTWHVP